MSSSKLLALVKGLTLSEKRDLKVFADLPSHRLMPRDKLALKELLSFNSQTLKKPEGAIWEELFKQAPLAEQNRIKTRLFQMIEKYVSLQQLNKNTGIKLLLQTELYEDRKIDKLANLSFNRSKKLLNDENDFDQKVFLFWLYQRAILREKDVRRADENLDTMENCLDEFYACNKLRILCERANRRNIIKKAESDRDLAREAAFLQEQVHSKLVQAYCDLFQLVSHGHEADFMKVKQFVDNRQPKLKKEHLQEFIAYMMNYCIRKFNAGDLDFARHYLDFIQTLEKEELLLIGGVLGIGRLKNIMLSLQLVEGPDAAQAFIDKYGSKVDPKHQDYLLLAQAVIYLDKDEVDEALEGLKQFQDSKVYLHDPYYKLTCDKLMLKCFYEQGDFPAILKKVDGIKAYVRSGRRLPEDRIAKNLNFLIVIKRLANRETVSIEESDFTIPDYRWLTKVLGGNS
ncbi:MAG: hypothetical protein KTR30_27360 [Saprospiraceae bacterium]|nr:hypothetical protein [Saprospiraceae bacterium]